MKQLERRVIAHPIEVRDNGDGTVGVRGYAAVYDSVAHGEVIKSSAFKRSVKQKADVRLMVNHDGVPLARTKSGTLTLDLDDVGLLFDAPSLDSRNSDVMNLISALERRDIDQCSFAGYFNDAPKNKEGVREVREVDLVDVSIVTYPWYEETSVGLTGNRNVDRELIEIRAMPADERSLLLGALADETEDRADDPEEVAEREEIEEPEQREEGARPTLTVAEARALLGTGSAA